MASEKFWEAKIKKLPPYFEYQGELRVSESGKKEMLVKCGHCGRLFYITPTKARLNKSCGCQMGRGKRPPARPKTYKPTIEELLKADISSPHRYSSRNGKVYKPATRKSELEDVFKAMFKASREDKNE